MSKGHHGGVVFFSMGSAVNTRFLDGAFKENIFRAFQAFPDYHFIVKLDKDDNVSGDQQKI